MPKRINWKKGMRLTEEVLSAADACTDEQFNKTLAIAAGGRMGLLPSVKPFNLQLSINKGFIEIEALDCIAITRDGYLIDAHFDTKFTNSFDTRLQIPQNEEIKEYILTINVEPGKWRETTDGFKESDYTFQLIDIKQNIAGNAFPIARIVNEGDWHEDQMTFVPPCLYITCHQKFIELHNQFLSVLLSIEERTRKQLDTGARTAISMYWPTVQEALITAKTQKDILTPQEFMALVQKVVGAIQIACEFDELINLEDGETYRKYAHVGYSYRIAYIRTKQGLGMCYVFCDKINKFSELKREEPTPEPEPKPEPKPDPRRTWGGKSI